MKLLDREVVLKALVGSWNYNLGIEEDIIVEDDKIIKASDKDYKALVLPNFNELYKGERFKNATITDTVDYEIHDVRKMPELFWKANLSYLEMLFSKDLWISGNPEMQEIYNLRHEIFNMNLPKMYDALGGTFRHKMGLLNKATEGTQYLVDQFGYDVKQAQHAYRFINFGVRYEETGFKDPETALRYIDDDLDFMHTIKTGFFLQENFERFANFYYESAFIHLEEKYKSQPVNTELKVHLDELVMSLVEKSIVKGCA
ncbi:nucleotidyltransferase domain-containing protein [Priestia megaterium]|uniref:nucleotidyltransferase domain-containing protein n=1 Tax=Priestia megaterium TaxID=1404 RepID=UPI000BFBEF31|nr:nucleotidyltransferase domain-containing protein [Priestia megaterium]PGO60570.1 hypothetical protein CN981_08455 [Priestia megaterium]